MTRIRRMLREDLTAVAELERACFSVPWTMENLCESLENSSYCFLVAECSGRIVGYGGMLFVADEGDVTNIAVDAAFRGRGIGTGLVRQLLEEGRARGAKAFTLEVRISNAAAIHVYEKLGFVSEGVRKHFYENPEEDARILWKREWQ